jgi:hypothetical protein
MPPTGLQILLLHIYTNWHDHCHIRQSTEPQLPHQKRKRCIPLVTCRQVAAFSDHRIDLLLPAMQRDYVNYPPEGPRPPTADELHDMVQKEQQRRRVA